MYTIKCLLLPALLLVLIMQIKCDDRVTCFSCRSTTKNPMPDCEEPFANPSKIANVTCPIKKGIKPNCIRAIGKSKTASKFVLRDCSYMHLNSPNNRKCGDINLEAPTVKDSRGFNGCVLLCNGTLCNSASMMHFWQTAQLISLSLLMCASLKHLIE